MAYIDEKTLEEIKQANNIVDVIASYLPVSRKGRNHVCLCPFHDDTNPSMVISEEKQLYNCFSCGAKGDVIGFVKNYEKISFIQAVQKLALNAGINLAIKDPVSKVNTNLKEYYEINQEAMQLYNYLINNDEQALNYLEERKLNNNLVEYFKLGYAPSNNVLTKLLKSKGYDLDKAVEMGLLNLHNNDYYDSYQNRLVYPIINMRDEVIGFSARTIINSEPKYLNSKQTAVFDKAKTLYNINNAQSSIKETKKVYLTEGPNDVAAFFKCDFNNSVCIMGTAFGSEHIRLLKSLRVEEVIVAFDGDEAGINASIKAIDILMRNQLKISYIDFKKLDPDEYLKEHGYQAFKDLVNNPSSALEFQVSYNYSKINQNNYTERKDFVLKTLQELRPNLDQFDLDYMYKYLANLTGLSYEIISSTDAHSNQNIRPVQVKQIDTKLLNDIDNAALNIIFFMMNDRKYFEIFMQEVGTFIDSKYRKMTNLITSYYLNNDSFDISALAALEDSETISKLADIYFIYDYEKYSNEKIFLDSIETIKLENLYLEKENLLKMMNSLKDHLEKAEISARIFEITQQIEDAKSNKFNK